MNIDEPTLMMVLGVASITASVMFFTLHASARHIAGVRLWALGSLSVGSAIILDAPRLVVTWQWASLLFNIPFSVGQALVLVGTAQFVGRPCARHTLSLLVAIVVVLTTVFTLVFPDSVVRIVSLSCFQASINVLTAWLLWRHNSFTDNSLIELAEQASKEFVRVTRAIPDLPSGATVSIGVAAMEVDGRFEFSKLVRLADDQLYLAKNGGRNRICSTTGQMKGAIEFMI